jgi:Arc/MetJ family transcription regulator
MNDDLIEKATAKTADRVLHEASGDVRAAVELSFRQTLGRPAASGELDRALSYVDNDPQKLKGLAWLLFNLDEFIFVK